MSRWSIRALGGLTLLLIVLPAQPARAQVEDYRLYFKPPETAMEYWNAVQFEIKLGAYKTAAEFIKGFMDKAPTEKELLDIESKEGMSAFLKLRSVPKWSDDPKVDQETKKRVEELIDGVTATLKASLADPQRIAKLVDQLAATPGERLYAIRELRRSGPYAVPHLVREMQESKGTDRFNAIVLGLPYLSREAMPALLAALDIDDNVVKLGLVDGIRRRPDLSVLTTQWDSNPVPHLHYIAGAPRLPENLRAMAAGALAAILQTHPEKLPPARTQLTREAERFYNHQVKFINPQNVTMWRWDGKELVMESATASRAEEHHGLRFAKLALDVDPAYPPAQTVALSIAVDKALTTAGLDQPLAKSPKLKELLTTINSDVLLAALDRAIDERRTAVALGVTRALGEIFEARAARARHATAPPLVRALNYPDRRVQFAAADSLLRLPGTPPAQGSTRIVEILRRIVQADPVQRVLIADFNKDRGLEIANAVKAAGYEPVVVQTGREALRRLAESADIDAIMVDYDTPDPGLRLLLAQLRADIDIAQLPLFITVPPLAVGQRPADSVIPLQRMAEQYRNVSIIPATNDPEVLKPLLDQRIAQAMGKPLSPEERKATMAEAMVWLKRLAVGEVPGYKPGLAQGAESAIFKAMRNEDLGPLAVEAAGRIPGRAAQRELAALVLDEAVRAEVRSAAALELARHIQANQLALSKNQIVGLENIVLKTEDGRLKANVGLALGTLRPDAWKTGDRLKLFQPDAPPAAGGKPEPGKAMEKEKEKAMEKEKDKE